MLSDAPLHRDIADLTDLLHRTVREQAGDAALERVESAYALARGRRQGEEGAEAALVELIDSLSPDEAAVFARATTLLYDLINLSEDRHRVRVIRDRERRSHPRPRPESIADAVGRLKQMNLSAPQVEATLGRLSIELVLTAHPTEAKRRTVRNKLRRLRRMMSSLDSGDLLPGERDRMMRDLRGQLVSLWQTDLFRPSRPTVLDEAERGLYVLGELWEIVPAVYRDLDDALRSAYPDHRFAPMRFLSFGSWIGGDRDGNPFVTVQVTSDALRMMRETALHLHRRECELRVSTMSVSRTQAGVSEALSAALEQATARWPAAVEAMQRISPNEVYRRWLKVIQWRLDQSRADDVLGTPAEGAYQRGEELVHDLTVMSESLRENGGGLVADVELGPWVSQARVFALHMARLDMRQESSYLRRVMTELFSRLGACENYGGLDEAARRELLHRTIDQTRAIDLEGASDELRETLGLFRLVAQVHVNAGGEPLGQFIISMTHEVSDVLCVLWLMRQAARQLGVAEPAGAAIDIAPLFETIDDLSSAAVTLDAMLGDPIYTDHLRRRGGEQTVMVGYSDSTKDGGYLAANWALYKGQADLHDASEKHGVRLIVFHGRGGSLGRGGGPAARSVMSLPHHVVDGAIRITEQGEVLAERYDDPAIARRHLEQITWATMIVSASPEQQVRPSWLDTIRQLAELSHRAYRGLVEHPGFIEYFAQATPIEAIEQMPIASRPSRRTGRRTLGDLRAIPWVFAWTQCRTILPAWYGLGAAMEQWVDEQDARWSQLRTMYRDWTFFKATIDNAALALAKADMGIAHAYTRSMRNTEVRDALWAMIKHEYDRSRSAVLNIAELPGLLADVPWLRQSIEQRNPLIDPLNLLQAHVLAKTRTKPAGDDAEATRVAELLRMTVQGVAAGMRTTG